jgi:hypothetical protein
MILTTNPPMIAETVAAVKLEIIEGILDGTFPADEIPDYSSLHDFCDANTLGGMCDDGFPEKFRTWEDIDDPENPMGDLEDDPWMKHVSDVQDIVDDWLRAGRPVRLVVLTDATLGLGSDLLDVNDDDDELAENAGVSPLIVEGLRASVAATVNAPNLQS